MLTIGLKELRLNLKKYIELAQKGEMIMVLNRSKMAFTIVPPQDEVGWVLDTDYTKIKEGGVPLREVLGYEPKNSQGAQ